MNREVKLKELQLLDAARRKFLHFQKTQRETELKRLDDEVQRKVLYTSLAVRKPVSGVSDQVRHKPGCTATDTSYS